MIETETTPNNLAAQWKQRLAEQAAIREQERQAEPTGEIELYGFKFVGRRLPLQQWIRAGRLPSALLRQMLTEKGDAEVDTTALAPDELIAGIHFQRDAILHSVVSPRIVAHTGPLAEDEVRYQDLCEASPELIDSIIAWVFAGCPGVPVPTREGEVSVDALSRFQQRKPGREPLRPGASGEASAETEQAVGHLG